MSQSMDLDKIQPQCFTHRASPNTEPRVQSSFGCLTYDALSLFWVNMPGLAYLPSTHHELLSSIFSSLYHIFCESQQLWPGFHSLSHSVFLYQLFCFWKSSAKCVFVHLSFAHSCHSQFMPQRVPVRHPLHMEHMPTLKAPANLSNQAPLGSFPWL